MGKNGNGNKKKTKSTNDRYLAKNGVYCNDLMLKTVVIIIILKIKQHEKDNFSELKYGVYQGYGGLPSIASARSQL